MSKVKKLMTVALVALICSTTVCVPQVEAKSFKRRFYEFILLWNFFTLLNQQRSNQIPGVSNNPTLTVTGSVTPPPTPFTPPSPANATILTFTNNSGSDVYLCVSTQSGAAPCTSGSIMQDGCPSNVSQIGIKDLGTGLQASFVQWPSSAATNGWYSFKNGSTIQVFNNMTNPYTGLNNGCLQGLVFGINIWGANCACNFQAAGTVPAGDFRCNGFPQTTPGPGYNSDTPATYTLVPNGSAAFEPSLNLPGMQCNAVYPPAPAGPPHESYDITCVNGSDWIYSVTMTPPTGGPYFTYNVGNGTQTVNAPFTTQNSWVLVNPPTVKASCDDNCIDPGAAIAGSSRAGVFPYGATVCTTNPDPNAPCTTTADPYAQNKQFCAATASSGCNFDRAPATGQVFGGTIAVTITGPATPPATCP